MDLFHSINSSISAHAELILAVGKIVLILIMLVLSAACLFVIISFAVWQRKLQSMEQSAQAMSDELIIIFAETRAGLQALKHSMQGASAKFNAQELVHSGGRLIMLFLNRERSIIAWSMLGWKLARNTFRYFLNRR